MCSQHAALWVAGLEFFFDKLSPKKTSSTQLCDFHVKIHSNGKKE